LLDNNIIKFKYRNTCLITTNSDNVNTSMEVDTNSNDAAKMDAITTINSSTASTADVSSELVSAANHNPPMEVDGTTGTADTATTGMVETTNTSTTTNSSRLYISIVAMDSNGSPRVVAGKSVSIVLFCEYFIRCLGVLTASFELSLPLFDCTNIICYTLSSSRGYCLHRTA